MPNRRTDLETIEQAITTLEDMLVDRYADTRADVRQCAIAPGYDPDRTGRPAYRLNSPLQAADILARLAAMTRNRLRSLRHTKASCVDEGLTIRSEDFSGPAPLLNISKKLNLTQCLKDETDNRSLSPDPRLLTPITTLARLLGTDARRVDEGLTVRSEDLSGPAPLLNISKKLNLTQ